LIFPNGLDAIELFVNLVFLLGTVDQFRNIFTYFEELKLNQVSKAEFIGLKRNRLLYDFGLKASPVAFKHKWRMELGNQRQNRVHVLDTFIECLKGSVVLDVFVLRLSGITLFGLHVLD
jgi:hypothetical protein